MSEIQNKAEQNKVSLDLLKFSLCTSLTLLDILS